MISSDYLVWGTFATIVHYVVPFALIAWGTNYNPWWGAVGGGFMDIDVVLSQFGYVPHRGVVHTPAMLVSVIAVTYLLGARHGALVGLWVGGMTHLVMDTLTVWGIMWLWPLTRTSFGIEAHLNSLRFLAVLVLVGMLVYIYTPDKDRFGTLDGVDDDG